MILKQLQIRKKNYACWTLDEMIFIQKMYENVNNWSYICCRVDLVHSQPKMSLFNLHKLLHTSSMMWKMMMKNSTGRGFFSQPLAATFIIIHYHGNYNSIIVRAHQFFQLWKLWLKSMYYVCVKEGLCLNDTHFKGVIKCLYMD